MKLSIRKRIIIVIVLTLIGCIAYWFFRPLPGYDVQLVHPRLRALQQPYQNIKTAYYLDGGSIGIEITDRDGRQEQFAIPAHLGDTNRYSRVYVGAMYDNEPDAVEIAEPEDTKWMLVHILNDYPNRTPSDDYCLMALTRRPVDVARGLIHKWRGDYDWKDNGHIKVF
jgi:hypothetical protein